MALNDKTGSVTRDRSFWGTSDHTQCGKIKALDLLLATWKGRKAKV